MATVEVAEVAGGVRMRGTICESKQLRHDFLSGISVCEVKRISMKAFRKAPW